MKLLLKKILILFVPFFIIALLFFITDPYKKIWAYNHYTSEYTMLNRGDVSTRVFLRKAKPYNSFIFGSSRSCAHQSAEWKKYLDTSDTPFSYGSWNESIYGIYFKLRLIDSLKHQIKNCFIIIDLDKIFNKDNYSNIKYDHYLISGRSKFDYYSSDFLNYITSPYLILTSIDYSLFHKKREYMKGFVGQTNIELDPISNDWYPNQTVIVDTNKINHSSSFYKRSQKQITSGHLILSEEKNTLVNILKIFHKHHTNYKFIIAPLYDQVKINPEDLNILYNIFNETNVYDFSGVNFITQNKYNYKPDAFHYTNTVGNLIFKEVCSK